MPRSKAASTEPKAKKSDAPLAVPAIRPMDANSMLAALAGAAPVVDPKSKETQRNVLNLGMEDLNLYSEFVPAKELADIFVEIADTKKAELKPGLFEAWTDLLWAAKTPPASPRVEVRDENEKVDCEGMFVVTEAFSVQLPDPVQPVEGLRKLFRQFGLEDAKISDMLDGQLDSATQQRGQPEISFAPEVGLRPFTELSNGRWEGKEFIASSDAEKVVSQKLMNFVLTQLTDEERALVIKADPKTKVRSGFLKRVCSYVTNREQLGKLLDIVRPQPQNRSTKFAVSDSTASKTKRLLQFAAKLLGVKDLPQNIE